MPTSERPRGDTLFLLPWLRLALVIRHILTTPWDSTTWPTVRQTLNDALKMQAAMRGSSSWH